MNAMSWKWLQVCAAMSAVMLIYLNISVSAHLWLFRLCKSSPLITFFFSCVPDGLLTQSNKKASWDLSVRCPQLSNWLLCKTKCDTHTHTRTNTMLQFYNETQTEDTNKLWQPTNNTFSHVPHLLFSHITPSLLPPVTLKYMSNTDSHKIFCLISPIKCVSLCAPGFLVWSHVWLFTTCCPKG